MLEKIMNLFKRSETPAGPTEPQSGVNPHGEITLHHIANVDIDYNRRGYQRCGLLTMTITDAAGNDFGVNLFGDGTDHIKFETHDRNEK